MPAESNLWLFVFNAEAGSQRHSFRKVILLPPSSVALSILLSRLARLPWLVSAVSEEWRDVGKRDMGQEWGVCFALRA